MTTLHVIRAHLNETQHTALLRDTQPGERPGAAFKRLALRAQADSKARVDLQVALLKTLVTIWADVDVATRPGPGERGREVRDWERAAEQCWGLCRLFSRADAQALYEMAWSAAEQAEARAHLASGLFPVRRVACQTKTAR